MALQTNFTIRGRNPDVLTCIANLSNDEVFTPPQFARDMLDSLAEQWAGSNAGEDLWTRSDLTFLDPFTKSGVFLREITARLTKGLESEIPDLDDRVDHILTKQVFGIGITELTAQLARRSLYCSKDATGAHSIAKSFTSKDGNIWFERLEHTWAGGQSGAVEIDAEGNEFQPITGSRCSFCGASKGQLGAAETHAYALLHRDNPSDFVREVFGDEMQFDVIIGNPPYQFDDGGYGNAASPIYNKFVDACKALDPRLLCLVIPARWYSGGKGLEAFRTEMLTDNRIRQIGDYPDSSEVFPGTQIKGGVCYFVWERDNPGDCSVTNYSKGTSDGPLTRPLLEDGSEVFIRFNAALPILKKILSVENEGKTLSLPDERKMLNLVSSSKPFGFRTFFQGQSQPDQSSVLVYQNGGKGYVDRAEVTKNEHVIDQWKVFIPRAGSGSDSFPHPILGRPFIGEPGSISTETYNFIGPFASQFEAQNCITYLATRFARFLVLMHKPTQDASRSVYAFLPTQDFSRPWTDKDLYEKYEITATEQNYIETLIRPMTFEGDGEVD